MSDHYDNLAHLQGRIIAQELFMRGVIVKVVMDFDDPEAALELLRSELLASLQNIERPLGSGEDEIWGHAADALNMEFKQITIRLRDILSRG